MSNTNLGSRLRELLEETGITQSELARRAGMKQQTISYLIHPDNAGRSSRYVDRIAEVLGANPVWLVTGSGEKFNPNVGRVGTSVRVPLCKESDAIRAMMQDDPEANTSALAVDSMLEEGSQAIEIETRAMEPMLEVGDRVIVSPGIKPNPGDLVCAVLTTDDQHVVVIRKYRPQTVSRFELAAINPDYPTLSSGDVQLDLLGVVVEVRKYRKP